MFKGFLKHSDIIAKCSMFHNFCPIALDLFKDKDLGLHTPFLIDRNISDFYDTLPTIKHVFCPPKPKALDIAILTGTCLAILGT